MVKVALYARVSTKIARKDSKGALVYEQDPENQLFKLREYVKSRGYEVHQEYEDRACGADRNRPELDRMMEDAQQNKFDIVLIIRLDRIARSAANLYELLHRMESFNVKLVCVDQPFIDTTTPMGKLMLGIFSAFAEFERELIKDRINDSFKRIKATGKTKSGKPVGKPPNFTHEQYAKAKLIKRTEPETSLHELERQTGIGRSTLRRKLKQDGLLNSKDT